ncbi:hypothetical protein H6504_01500 [Candidatus Woesearchaeota archaeon]|nr:hypothetical protein [Candidatus Woesearchaeota archaeon]
MWKILIILLILAGCAPQTPVINESNQPPVFEIDTEEHDHSIEITGQELKSKTISEIGELYGIDSQSFLDEVLAYYELEGEYTLGSTVDELRFEADFKPSEVKEIAENMRSDAMQASYSKYHTAYKKVLFSTGQQDPKSVELLVNFGDAWQGFKEAYGEHPARPYVNDAEWQTSMQQVDETIQEAALAIGESYAVTHEVLEGLRPIWQDIQFRNEQYSRTYFMTEFHTVMERMMVSDIASIQIECDIANQLWDATMSETHDLNPEQLKQFTALAQREKGLLGIACSDSLTEENAYQVTQDIKRGFVKTYMQFG